MRIYVARLMSLLAVLAGLAAAICICASSARAQAAAERPIALAIDTAAPGPVINRNIFGQFAEHLGTGIYGGVWVGEDSEIPNVRGIRSDVVGALRALRVPNVRWPGGCFADYYHWRSGVGPREARRTQINTDWGAVTESNHFGTDEFFDFIEQIDSEAFISVNMGSGTVQEAAEWFEYMTGDPNSTLGRERAANGHPEPYRVAYLGLGNESWDCGGGMTPEYYVDQMKPYARFVRNLNTVQTGESAMQRVVVGPKGDEPDYTQAVMAAWADKSWAWDFEGLSIHFYTTNGWPPEYDSTDFGEREYATLVNRTRHMDEVLRSNARIMDRYDPEKKVAMVVDEWGVWLKPLPGSHEGFLAQQNSLRDGIIAALNINMFARHADRVRAANIAQMINVLQAMILTDGPRMALTPTYHVFRMYVPFQDATFVPVSYNAEVYRNGDVRLPRLDALAARDKDGMLWLALVNVDPNRETRVTLSGYASATGEVLTAPAVNSINTFDAPDVVRPSPYSASARNGVLELALPSKSITVVRIS